MGDRSWRAPAVWVVAAMLAAACSGGDAGEAGPGGDPSTGAGEVPDGDGDGPAVGQLVAGAGQLVGGTYVWTDHVYDDRGANAGPGDRTDIASAGGDLRYGDGANAADLVQVHLARDGDGDELTVTALLQTVDDEDVPLLGVGFDTDADPATGADTLPGGAWAPAGPLGLERVLVAGGSAAELLAPHDGDWSPVATPEVAVDAEANTITATFDLDDLGDLGDLGDDAGGEMLAYAAVGPATAEGSWYDGGGALHDLAFVADEPAYQWQDYVQADVLGGLADPTLAAARIDLDDLGSDATTRIDELAPGFATFLYRSGLDLGDGVRITADGGEYLGRYQPYLVYVPEDLPGDGRALSVFLHGLSQNHLGSVGAGTADYVGTARPLSDELHQLAPFARDGLDFPPHNLTVWPLARGEGLFYEGIAERDVLDVLDDATARLDPDPDRVILTGGSMGGMGAFRLGALYPDRFSVVAPIIGLARDDALPLLGNLHNVPVRQINGGEDPLVPVEGATASTDALVREEIEHRAWVLHGRGHEAGGYVYDCVYEALPTFERERSPARVRYTTDPSLWVDDPDTGLRLAHRGAYWVSDMAPASGAPGRVDLRLLPDADDFDVVVSDGELSNEDEGRDLCGPAPGVRTGDAWRERTLERTPVGDRDERSELRGEVAGLDSLTVDLAAARVDGSAEVTVALDVDAPVELTLAGRDPGTTVEAGGERHTVGDDGRATVTVEPGGDPVRLGA